MGVNTDIQSKAKQLDELMKEIYKCSFVEMIDKAIQRGLDSGKAQGFDCGLHVGYRLGKADGQRAAKKGPKGDAKKRGRPLAMEGGLIGLMISEVDKARAERMTVKEGVSRFLETMGRGIKETDGTNELPKQNVTEGIYYRFRNNKKALSGIQEALIDDSMRTRIRHLKKQLLDLVS